MMSKRAGEESLDHSHEHIDHQKDSASASSRNNIVEEIKEPVVELNDLDEIDEIPIVDHQHQQPEQSFEVIKAQEVPESNRSHQEMRKATPPLSRERSPPSNVQFSRKPTITGSTVAKSKAPVVINMQEIGKEIKAVNIFKKNLKDAEKRPTPSESPGQGQINQRMSPNPTVNNFTLNPSKQVLQEQPDSSRTNRSEANYSTASHISNSVFTPSRDISDRSNQQNIAPENESFSGKYQFEAEKKQLLNRLETAELQSRELRQQNEGLREDLLQREQENRRLNELLESTRKQLNTLSTSKQGGNSVDFNEKILKQNIEELNTHNSALMKENAELNSKLEELKAAMYKAGKDSANKLRELQIELEKQKDSSGEAKLEVSRLREQNNVLADRCSKLEHDLRNVILQNERLANNDCIHSSKPATRR